MELCGNWENARNKLACYKRREPEKTILHRVVSAGRDKLPLVWEERFQAEYGALRQVVLDTFDAYLNCGLLEHGAARVYCDTCRTSFFVAFSCKGRNLCPSCSAKRAVKFAEHLYDEVLEEVEQRHIVATIPVRLRCFFRYDRKLLDILFSALWKSIREELCVDEAVPGLVATVQTSGEALNWNSHLHGMLSDGLWKGERSFERFSSIDQDKLTQSFAKGVLKALKKRGLIDEATEQQILSQNHSGFSVWLGEPFKDKARELFVARYIERGPISLEKLSLEGDKVIYTTKEGKRHTFDTLEFLALLSSHIANPGESLTRYFGHYSSRKRGERKKLEQEQSPSNPMAESLPEPKKKPSFKWAECMKRMYEINPMLCPKCGKEMRILSFITDYHELQKIMASMHSAKAQAPPPRPNSNLGAQMPLAA